MYGKNRTSARVAAVTATAAAAVLGTIAGAPGAAASSGYDHAPSWCAEWYIADGGFHCSKKFPAGQSYDYYSNHGYRGEQFVRQFHGATKTATPASTAPKKTVKAASGSKYWYRVNNHWYWTQHFDKYQRKLANGAVGNGTRGPGGYSSSVSRSKPQAKAPVQSQSSGGSGVWDRIAKCESGGNWSINTGNGFYGGLQFTLSSWRAVGGSGMPNQASRSEQINRGQKLQALQGWGAWPHCAAFMR